MRPLHRTLSSAVCAATLVSLTGWAIGGLPLGPARAASDPASSASSGSSALALSGPGAAGAWTGAWASGQQALDDVSYTDTTLRLLVHPTTGGSSVRVRLANTFGDTDIAITSASVGVAEAPGAAELDPGSVATLTFGGEPSGTIAAGARLLSDPVGLDVAFGDTLAVDLHVVDTGDGATTGHYSAGQGSCQASGDHVGEADGAAFTCDLWQWYLLDGVDVAGAAGGRAAAGKGSVVALGDSITDGAYASWNESKRWPDRLAERIQADPRLRGTGVLNQGIGGNQVLTYRGDCCGTSESALARFDRDVVAQTGARTVIIADGINDLGYHAAAADLIAGLKQLAVRAHAAGLRVVGTTITPYGCDDGCFDEQQEADRQTVNRWIRSSGVFDGYADFDRAVRDASAPDRLDPAFDAGDHLHLNDDGYAALAGSIDLRLLR